MVRQVLQEVVVLQGVQELLEQAVVAEHLEVQVPQV